MNESGTGAVHADSPKQYPRRPAEPKKSSVGGVAAVVACVIVAVSTPVLISYHRATPGAAAPAGTPSATPQVPAPVIGTPEPSNPSPEPATVAPAPAPPPPPQVPRTGSGQARVAAYARPAADKVGRQVRVRLEVENEVPVDADEAARIAADTLQDPRSWTGKGAGVHFDFVGTEPAELTIYIGTPATTDRRCLPLRTGGEVSCRNGNSVNLNALRWVDAVPDYGGDVALYRQYLVNHEVGHFLGHGHVQCPGPGKPAPVMMQQTKGLEGCLANPWP